MSKPLYAKNDVVRHATGGPDMHVEDIGEDGRVWCVWRSGAFYRGGAFNVLDLIRSNVNPGT
jgi:uncharacterized protein YodC (DUF2158 family)